MNIKASNYHEITEKTIESVNYAIAEAKEKGFTNEEQLIALNTGNIVQLLGAIAHSLAEIADNMKGGEEE